jgi:hypothetical protein
LAETGWALRLVTANNDRSESRSPDEMTIGSRLIGQTLDALHLISLYAVNPFFFLGFLFMKLGQRIISSPGREKKDR